MKFYTIISSTNDSGKQTQTPQHLHVLGLSMLRSFGFWTKIFLVLIWKVKDHCPSGHFRMVVLPHSIGLKTLGFCPYLPNSFPEDRNSDEFHSGFVGLGCFCLEEKQTHTHTHTNKNYTSTQTSPRHQEQSLGQIWPTTSSSSSSDPTCTLPCWFSCCLESHQRLTRSVWHHLCYSPFLHFCPTRHPIIQGFQSSTCSGTGSSDQVRKDRRWKRWPGAVVQHGFPNTSGNLMF